MNTIRQNRIHNSMARRVLRHTSVATLYRRIDSNAGSLPLGQGKAVVNLFPSTGISKAILLPPTSQLPVGYIIGEPPSAGRRVDVVGLEDSAGLEEISQTGSANHPQYRDGVAIPTRSPGPIARKAVFSKPFHKNETFSTPKESRQPNADPASNQTRDNDPQWSRLQTILRKHREKQASEPATPTEGSELDSSTSSKNIVQRSQLDTKPGPRARQPIESSSPVLVKPRSGAYASRGEEGDALAEIPVPVPPAEPFTQAQLTKADEAQINPSGSQIVPLQDVWPVQLNDDILENPAPATSTERHTDSSIDFIPARRPPPEEVRPVFQKVHTEASTSRIERYPSDSIPDGAHTAQPDRKTEMPDESLANQTEFTPTNSQRKQKMDTRGETSNRQMISTEIGPLPEDLWQILGQSPPTSASGEDVPGEPSAFLSEIMESQPTPVQTKPDESHPAKFEKTVNNAPAKSLYSKPEEGRRTEFEPFQRPAFVDASSLLRPSLQEFPESNETNETIIQHQPVSRDALLETSDVTAEKPEPDPVMEPISEVLDEQELARRVYAELRRRLSIEWERVRRNV